ncbi:LysE family transporter [Undibacterium sp. CY18W]|uniref:LysE family transporter n=1 Tax=Undibacterium hunanense TaxID=2762292 RepID=A0ABR6ZNZ7_9BURK|nr:LysE family transporter [Undibacterium hunanense]MBC3917303.1 LysE family transporter [Undibacterium hunanense]
MALHTWIIYAIAVLGLSLTPGPNGLLAMTHGALYGARKATYTVVGGVVGFTCLIALSMFGLGAILQASSSALLVLKLAGGIYLVWLGIQLWRAPALHLAPKESAGAKRGISLFRLGLLTAIANPKVLLFYGAFLPQFIDMQRALLPQFVVMTVTFAVIEFLVEYLLARLAHYIRPWLERGQKRFNRTCGTLFVFIGAALPLIK